MIQCLVEWIPRNKMLKNNTFIKDNIILKSLKKRQHIEEFHYGINPTEKETEKNNIKFTQPLMYKYQNQQLKKILWINIKEQ